MKHINEELPIKVRALFMSTDKPSKSFRESPWYGAIFRTIAQNGYSEWVYPYEIKNHITEKEPDLVHEAKKGDTWLGKKLGSHLSQLRKAWKILESEELPGVRFQKYRINKKYYDDLVELINETFE